MLFQTNFLFLSAQSFPILPNKLYRHSL